MNGPRQPAQMSPQGRPMPGQSVGEQPKDEKKKRNRKESDFFYVNRKGVCFFMFVVFLIAIIVLFSGVLGMMPSLKDNAAIKTVLKFTAVFQIKDMTPLSEREDTTDEEGNTVAYQDKTQYVTFVELIMGAINNITGKSSAEDAEPEVQADEPADGEDGTESAGGFDTSTPFYDGYIEMAEVKGISDNIAVTLIKFVPFALIAFAVFALWYMIKAFAALFGKRVFKNFGLGSILMIICAATTVLVAIAMISVYAAEAGAEEVTLQFGAIGDYITGLFESVPADAAEAAARLQEIADAREAAIAAGETPPVVVPFTAAWGQVVLLVLPVITLVLSFGARRKIPYSIFD